MQIYSVKDPEFKSYGRIVNGYESEITAIAAALEAETPLPAGTDYVPDDPAISGLAEASVIGESLFGGLPAQFGWCNGHNSKLNCLEYHRNSEFNLGSRDFILLLVRQDEIEDGNLSTDRVKAFRCPADTLIEVYATTLHYAPCGAEEAAGFKVLVALPEGTNLESPTLFRVQGNDDAYLWAQNKWLLAHPDSAEASDGAKQALTGENIDLTGSY